MEFQKHKLCHSAWLWWLSISQAALRISISDQILRILASCRDYAKV
jgi:hypothetical protein